MTKNFYILCALWRALVMKEIYVFLSNKAMAGMIMVYVPMFMFFFAFFLYPNMVPLQELPEIYQSGLLFAAVYPLMVNSFMGLGQSIVIDTARGVLLKLAAMPVDRWLEALARMSAQFILILWTICLGWLALFVAAYLKHVTPLPSPFSFPIEIHVSLIPIYLLSTGLALIFARIARGRIQFYTIIAVAMINIVPFLSGMFIPLFMLPKVLQEISRFNPFSLPFYLYVNAGGTAITGAEGKLLIAFAEGVIVFGAGLYLHSQSFGERGGIH
jgi:ABC-type multidrug transport system permease subunit